jgi:phage tail sheath protein FI
MVTYTTPGVYFEWLDQPAPLAAARTDIAGFVGIAARGRLHEPMKVESWTQFTSNFGGNTRQGFLAAAVHGFFANGGRTCWVVRVGDPLLAKPAMLDIEVDLPHLFSLTLDVAGELYSQEMQVSTRLRDQFQRHQHPLTGEATVQGDPVSSSWTIVDGANRYVIRKEDQTLNVYDRFAGTILRLTALSPGKWANSLAVSAFRTGPGRFTLALRLPDGTRELWTNLSLDVKAPRSADRILSPQVEDPSRESTWWEENTANMYMRVSAANTATLSPNGSRLVKAQFISNFAGTEVPPLLTIGTGTRYPAGGKDALWALRPEHFSGVGAPLDQIWGLATLEVNREIAIVAIPDIMPKAQHTYEHIMTQECGPEWIDRTVDSEVPPAFGLDDIIALQRELLAHCERLKNRIAILDAPPGMSTEQELSSWANNFQSTYAALYYPWLRVSDPTSGSDLFNVPPSGHIAGIYARVEMQVGPHKAPANEVIEDAQDVVAAVDDLGHGILNEQHINVLRAYPGRGLRVFGARVASTPEDDIRYVNVRRLLLMIERSIEANMQWLAFEPNNETLWRDTKRVLSSFLEGLWQQGRLDGATADDAFDVICDASINTQVETDAGQLLARIEIRPPWPAEFVIVRVGRTESGIATAEG